MTTQYIDTTLANAANVRSLVTSQQTAYYKVRGSAALAAMVADGFVAIKKILTNATSDTQAAILDQHGVKPASGNTSQFTPWIKVLWGEQHHDKTKTFVDAEGITRPVWVPDRSMEVYHHTMAELDRLGITSKHAAYIIEHGGALVMANKRKARLAAENKPSTEAVIAAEVQFYLEEMPAEPFAMPFPLPEKTGEFFTLLCRKSDDGSTVVLDVADARATGVLNRRAKAMHRELRFLKRTREAAIEGEKIAAEREAAAYEKGRNEVLGGMTADERKALMAKAVEQATAPDLKLANG